MNEVRLLKAQVGHRRTKPRVNTFLYNVFYVAVPITKDMSFKSPKLFSIDKFNVFSIRTRDSGAKSDRISLYEFIDKELSKAGFKLSKDNKVYLVSHPRIFGYAFNPISFWLVTDKHENLKAVLCEVHNTFKQTHNYLLAKSDMSVITKNDEFKATKKLYVSPYTKMEGYYKFIFDYNKNTYKADINYFDKKLVLETTVSGTFESITSKKILKLLFIYPFMTIMVVVRIHTQALKLFIKRIPLTLKTRPKKYKNNKTTTGR